MQMINPQNSLLGSTIVCNSDNIDSELKRSQEFQVFGWNKDRVCIHINGGARWFKSVHFDRKKTEADLKAEENFRYHQTGGDLGPTGHGDICMSDADNGL